MAETTITGLPNAAALTGNERVPVDQAGATVDTSTQAIANLSAAAIAAAIEDHQDEASPHSGSSPTFANATVTGLLTANHIHGNVAGSLYFHVKNTSGVTLPKGTPIRVTGAVGDTTTLEVAAADALSSLTMPAVGILDATLLQNGEGHAVIAGEITGLNTIVYQVGQALYVGTGGVLTNVRPATNTQAVGVVGRVHASTGTIAVSIDAVAPTIAQLGGVASNDSRLSDSRTPTAHKSTHATGGSDALTPGDIGAATAAQGALAASAVQTVSGTAPIITSGGTTPTISISAATTSAAGSMSAADKTKLDGIATGAEVNVNADWNASSGDAQILNKPTIPAAADAAPQALGATAAIGTSTDYAREDHVHQRDTDVIVLACSDETTALTTGTNRVRFRMPFAATLVAVRANVNTAPTGSTLIVDINEAGTSVLGTKLSIDATEFSSTTAASAATITDSSLADDAEISIDIDQIGSTVAGAGLKVTLVVRRS